MTEFILPDIGEGIVECELVEWLVAEGDALSEDQPVAEVMTDKALVQIPAPQAGVLTRRYYQAGEQARVGQPLFAWDSTDASEPSPARGPAETAAATTALTGAAVTKSSAVTASDNDNPAATAAASSRALATPAVRRICREHELDIRAISGSGKNGRVLKEDVLRTLANTPSQSVANKHQKGTASQQSERLPLRGIAVAMYRQMNASLSIPQFGLQDELDMSALLALVDELKADLAQHPAQAPHQTQSPQYAEPPKLTFLAVMIKALALVLKEFPHFNARLDESGPALVYQSQINIGVAMDSEQGLVVPSIKEVDRLSIPAVARELQRLSTAAHSGRLQATDFGGASLSISNIGALGGISASPRVNPPELAIVALGRIQQLPRFNAAGEVVAMPVLQVSWSADHRILDGATLARFNQRWLGLLRQPSRLLLLL